MLALPVTPHLHTNESAVIVDIDVVGVLERPDIIFYEFHPADGEATSDIHPAHSATPSPRREQ